MKESKVLQFESLSDKHFESKREAIEQFIRDIESALDDKTIDEMTVVYTMKGLDFPFIFSVVNSRQFLSYAGTILNFQSISE